MITKQEFHFGLKLEKLSQEKSKEVCSFLIDSEKIQQIHGEETKVVYINNIFENYDGNNL